MPGKFRWFILTLIFIATCINYLDRQIIGLLKPLLEKEFNWTEQNFSRIVMAFTAAYAIGLLLAGNIIDKIGTKSGYLFSIIIWSVAGMAHALARSVNGFIFARIGLGIGEAGNFPAGVKAIAEWFPKQERGLATGIFNSGTSVGVVLAVFLVPLILHIGSWKEVFWITGGLGFIWLILWLVFYDNPEKSKYLTKEEYHWIKTGQEGISADKLIIKLNLLRFFQHKQTWAYITGKALIDPIFWFFLFWLPSYFASSFSLDLKRPSWELMIIYTATTIGSIGGGYASSLLIRRGWPTIKSRKFVLLIFAITELTVLLTQYAHVAWIAVLLLSIAVAVHQAWATNIFTLASDLFPKEAVGTVVGIGGMAGALGGIVFPLFVGKLLDRFKELGNITDGYNILFTICGCTYLIAYIIIHLLTRKAGIVSLNELR
jgi:ACS family hexuronate transporter-like MFS transporter